ncbi:MAG TPA: hypothetical protein VLW75_05175 [Rhizomicrobium sp.]|nr:hypothetical protein [Rhizomicrobium sp.]
MDTIPVGKSIGGAYGFLFGRILTILGLSWLPAAIYGAGRLAFVNHVMPGVLTALHNGAHPSPGAHIAMLALFLFSLLMFAIIALPLNREALGSRGETVLARLVIGMPELRLFGAYVLIDVILIALIVAIVFGLIGVVMGTKAALGLWAQGTPLAGWPVLRIVHIASAVIAILILLFVALRLSFLISVVTAAEGKASLRRAWELSSGNFWRILAIVLAILVPVAILTIACEYAVLGSLLSAFHHGMFAGRRPDPSAAFALVQAHGPVLVAIAAAIVVILNALFAGAAATAYRALVPPPSQETESTGTGARIEPFAEPSPPADEAVAEETPVAHEPAPEPQPETHAEISEEAPAEHVEEPIELHEVEAADEAHDAPPAEHHEEPGAHAH